MILDFHCMMIMAKITYNNKIITIDPLFSYNFLCYMMSAIRAITIPTMLECQQYHLSRIIYYRIIYHRYYEYQYTTQLVDNKFSYL